MTIRRYTRPHVLVLSGLDPSGGAGIQADIQAITALGCHPLPVVTCLTVQDTRNVYQAEPVAAELVRRQLECVAADVPIHAIKTGALGTADIVDVLVAFAQTRSGIPLIADPVIKAAGGGDLADAALVEAMKSRLVSAGGNHHAQRHRAGHARWQRRPGNGRASTAGPGGVPPFW